MGGGRAGAGGRAGEGEGAAKRATRGADGWNGERVRALRGYLGESQQELAERLGTRQQTVSEWETGHSQPRRMSRRLLGMVAEEVGFYEARTDAATERSAEAAERGGPAGGDDSADADGSR